MNDLIVGGIYLTPHDNFLIVVNMIELKRETRYLAVWIRKDLCAVKDLRELSDIKFPCHKYKCFVFYSTDTVFKDFFDNGYCGKINDILLNSLLNKTHKDYFVRADSLLNIHTF